ncbi:Radical SAM superfamily protein [Pigmentiphaga humi]|uniref:Radical SAM superfamily protein n=1 Tax=Pigmentiphaga humi TaxID=2478468 RepID=A0A3P4AY60_9BURK|nr:PA0069 family radical SAM protein [Pigmentiphaga humi]VCU68983.1 Radical SAM superfamily protein [Pigmentiphaga humi]
MYSIEVDDHDLTEPGFAAAPPVPQRGRGAVANVAHRFDADQRSAVDDGWAQPPDEAPRLKTEVAVERARKILSRNDSPDIPFDRAINPYRGCEHGCVYCFARPTHAYLGWSPGLDFETRLVAKANAVEALRAELSRPGYRVDVINIGSATDAYQPIERSWKLTRGLLELLLETRHPVSLVTKGALLGRDVDLLARLAELRLVAVYVTIPTLDGAVARTLEPRAAAPWRRVELVRELTRAGVPVGVSLAPVIPFITDDHIEQVLEAVAQAGAQTAFYTMLRLPWEVRTIFTDWLEAHFPDRKARVLHRLEDLRGGRLNDPRFGSRMRGEGIWADLVRQRFMRALRQFGLAGRRIELDIGSFRPPGRPAGAAKRGDARQISLFD